MIIHITKLIEDNQEKSRPKIALSTPSCSNIFFQTKPTDTGANTHGKKIIDLTSVENLKLPKKIKIDNIKAIAVCIKTAPKINKKVFLRAIQKYLSSYIFAKLSKPTNFLNRFVSNPENSKKLNNRDVNPGITLKVRKINNAGKR
jgi:hypothetical protein